MIRKKYAQIGVLGQHTVLLTRVLIKIESMKNIRIVGLFCLIVLVNHSVWAETRVDWKRAERIVRSIKTTNFPDRDFIITDFGAVADEKSLSTSAIRDAIEACHNAGGGRVVVPEGNFLTGSIYLKSNVNLFLSQGACLRFSTDPKDYLPIVHTRWEGVELMNYAPLIYAYKERNIAVTGPGVLDGQASAENWWRWNGSKRFSWREGLPHQNELNNRPALFAMGDADIVVPERVFGDGHFLRPQFVQPYQCDRVLLQDFTIKNSPMWILHPVLCNDVVIRGVTIKSGGPNTDGCDPESCRKVLIEDCDFWTGDDCIALKSGRNGDGRRIARPVEDVVIRNCRMHRGHGGVVIGSEITGGAKNVFIENCMMDSPDLKRAIRIKTNFARGGTIDGIFVRDLTVGQVSETVLKINLLYEEGAGFGFVPTVRNVVLENVRCKKTRYPLFLLGTEDSKIVGLLLKNVVIEEAMEPSVMRGVKDLMMEDVHFQLSKEVNGWGSVIN